MIRKRLLWLPLVVALAFVATACPGQSGSGGTTGTTPTTIVSSNGCVGLYNEHITELFALAQVGTQVLLI